MFEPENPFRVLYGSVGNNKHNDYNDVTNAKHKLQRLAYYKDTVDNGYIDEPLRQSIQSYQRDNNLSVDGFMNPGGETETHMYGDLLGLPKSTTRYDEGSFKSAAAPAIPAIFGIFRGARAAKKVWDIWKSVPPVDRQEALKESCYRAYNLECNQCRRLSELGKEKESAICYAEAAENLAECIKDNG
jgi:hypothetical protein